jgi:hypothetical protein
MGKATESVLYLPSPIGCSYLGERNVVYKEKVEKRRGVRMIYNERNSMPLSRFGGASVSGGGGEGGVHREASKPA